eukprot:CAMPEP_0174322686 /NCGR_PEP_ID=MMETSP0810-20121108/11192_1 /TAXON_ID=73025 ORGANISM="Eutreptiella gymnastica-like, Strain CCMP1594" /NCGR_SAMPLE_ID=MMETSP0810 /ASSEMBLY_ACC=CAM_ASM_000659 /LENGTH=394 /DNA_ID=CAMNT_0015434635 /DNA_START=39 /DNA_END=1220 /DNA_ORIENTATION=+
MATVEGTKLANAWTFWTSSMRGAPEVTRREQFDTMEAFWDLLPNHSVSELPDKTCLHVFKDDIQPLWEDPKNLCGGHFKITAKTQPHSESMWLDVVMNLLGEQFPHRELVNGVSIMANKVGNNLVKIWIAVVKRPVVHALREFIRATLKDEDYFAEDVRLVPHKLVVKGAGKKIPGVTPEAAPESMATPPAASSTSPSIPSPSSRSPNPSPRHSHPTGSRSRRRSGNLPPPPTCANTPAPVPAVGGPATAMYPEPVIPCSSSHGDLCFETLSINGVPLSPTPSCAVSEVSYSSTPPTPRSVAGADCEVGCAKPFKAHRRTWSNESYGGCYSGLSTPHSIGGSEIDLFSDGNSPRSREDEDGGGDAGRAGRAPPPAPRPPADLEHGDLRAQPLWP